MEEFFQQSSKLDEIELKELLLRRYHNIDYIMSMEIMDFLTFIDKAIQKEDDEKLYQMWLARYILMTKESFITFEAFKDMVTGKNIDMRSTAEILSEIDEVEALFERR